MPDPRYYVVSPREIEDMLDDEEITLDIAIEALSDDIRTAESDEQDLRGQIEFLQAELERRIEDREDAEELYNRLVEED